MADVQKGKELWVTTPNEVGVLSKVSNAVSSANLNFVTLSAWGQEDKGYFRMLTSDNAKATTELKGLGYTVDEKDVLLVNVGNQSGALTPIAKKVSDMDVEINYCYGTAWGDKTVLVLSTKDNEKVYSAMTS